MRTRLLVAAALSTVAAALVSGCATARPDAGPPAPHPVERAEPAHPEAHEGEPGESAEDEAHEAEASKDRDHVDADGVVRRGQPLTTSLETTPVSKVLAQPKAFDGKTVKLAGTVAQVCAKRGCWFVVQGDKPEDHIRISTRAKDIYVPHSAVGMTVLVEGTLSAKADGTVAVDVVGLEMRKS